MAKESFDKNAHFVVLSIGHWLVSSPVGAAGLPLHHDGAWRRGAQPGDWRGLAGGFECRQQAACCVGSMSSGSNQPTSEESLYGCGQETEQTTVPSFPQQPLSFPSAPLGLESLSGLGFLFLHHRVPSFLPSLGNARKYYATSTRN